MPTAKSQTLSLGLHAAAVAFLLLVTSHSIVSPPPLIKLHSVVHLGSPARLHSSTLEQRAGGSNRTLLPAKHGAPPPPAPRIFIPPKAVADPKLPMPVGVTFDTPTITINFPEMGDPLSTLRLGGLGNKDRGGIGPGCCEGVGDEDGRKPGMTKGSLNRHIKPPELIRQVDPEFSEEARKAKYSGVVVLTIEVDTNGRTRAFHVVEGPGLGLEQKAIEAVAQWLFRPGSRDGKPVVTSATVEVRFRLL